MKLARVSPGQRFGRGLLSAAAALSALSGAGAGAIALAGPASASADVCTLFGVHTIEGVQVPQGTFCGYINGNGTYVDNFGGLFVLAGPLCNYQVGVWFYTKQNTYTGISYETSFQGHCTANAAPARSVAGNVPVGYAHVSLLTNNQTVSTVTINIE